MSKVDLMEMEDNPNYESEKAEQAELKAKYEAQDKKRKIEEAKQLLLRNGYVVRLLKDEI